MTQYGPHLEVLDAWNILQAGAKPFHREFKFTITLQLKTLIWNSLKTNTEVSNSSSFSFSKLIFITSSTTGVNFS